MLTKGSDHHQSGISLLKLGDLTIDCLQAIITTGSRFYISKICSINSRGNILNTTFSFKSLMTFSEKKYKNVFLKTWKCSMWNIQWCKSCQQSVCEFRFHQVALSFPLVTTQLNEVYKMKLNLQKRLKIGHIKATSSTVFWCSWCVWVFEKQKPLEKVHARYSSTQIQNMSAKAGSIQLFK